MSHGLIGEDGSFERYGNVGCHSHHMSMSHVTDIYE